LVEHLREAEVERLAQLVEAVHVEVVDGEAAVVDVDEREGGARDPVGDAETATEALHERRLAGAEVSGQDDDVAGTGQPGDRFGELAGLVDRGGGGLHGHGAASRRSLARTKSDRICARTTP